MIYGSVTFKLHGQDLRADLTESGWRVSDPEFRILASCMDLLHSPGQYGPSDGDPIRLAVSGAAAMLSGTFTLAKLNPPPKGVIF